MDKMTATQRLPKQHSIKSPKSPSYQHLTINKVPHVVRMAQVVRVNDGEVIGIIGAEEHTTAALWS